MRALLASADWKGNELDGVVVAVARRCFPACAWSKASFRRAASIQNITA